MSSKPQSFATRIVNEVRGIDRTVVLELHSPALESAFEMPLLHLRADELMLPVIRSWNIADLVIVSPDAGGLKRARARLPGPGPHGPDGPAVTPDRRHAGARRTHLMCGICRTGFPLRAPEHDLVAMLSAME